MATAGFPALQINTQGPSPINTLGDIMKIRQSEQAQQLGEIQLQEARVAQQSRETLMALFAKNGGDFNQTYADAQSSGKVTPSDLINFRTSSVALQTQAAKLTTEQLGNIEKTQGMMANELEAFKALPVDQRTPDAIKASIARLGTQGVDVSKFMPVFQSVAQNPTDDNIRQLEIGFKGEQWVLANEKAQREEASAPTVTQAQQKTQAELSKAVDEAQAAHVALLSMPTPEEAKTQRAATLLETRAKAAASFADAKEKTVQTALLGAEPVFAFDPATNQRVLSTMPEAKAKGFTNPVKASEGDISKEVETTRQFNDVQMNVSRYKLAFQNSSTMSVADAAKVSQILSDEKLAGRLAELPSVGITGDVVSGIVKAKDWNSLSEENQDLVIGYLRAKGSVIAYQKALTQTGRTSAEAMKIEMNNLPSPIEGGTVGLKRLGSFQENIDVASQGQIRVPWLPTTQQVRQTIEGNAMAQRQAQEQQEQIMKRKATEEAIQNLMHPKPLIGGSQ